MALPPVLPWRPSFHRCPLPSSPLLPAPLPSPFFSYLAIDRDARARPPRTVAASQPLGGRAGLPLGRDPAVGPLPTRIRRQESGSRGEKAGSRLWQQGQGGRQRSFLHLRQRMRELAPERNGGRDRLWALDGLMAGLIFFIIFVLLTVAGICSPR